MESQPLVFPAGEDGELTLADWPFLQMGKPRLGGAGPPVLQREIKELKIRTVQGSDPNRAGSSSLGGLAWELN